MNRRQFLLTGAGAVAGSHLSHGVAASPLELPADLRDSVQRRKRRVVVQYDAHDAMEGYWKLHPDLNAPFEQFRDAIFSYVDAPGSQIDALWWDIAGTPLGAAYPSKVLPPVSHPLLQRWLHDNVDWVEQLVNETRRRKLEVFWNHRVCEVEFVPGVGLSKLPDPLKVEHPDWVTAASWWPHGMWNLAAPGLREYKVALLRELATHYDLDGIQIDFCRHLPCLPVGRQWELRGEITEFMRMVRRMLLEVAQQRGRPLLLAAKVPQNLAGCREDGFDVGAWAEQRLIDLLTLGSRSMDVNVEEIRAAVGHEVQLQPCFDDHHATDGYRYGPIEFLRGVFANHLQRGADSVVTFNWSIGRPEVSRAMGEDPGPLAHETAYQEIGELKTMAGKDKFFAVERRGGYPWSDGFFNRNDTAPLPGLFTDEVRTIEFTLHISDTPTAANASLTLRAVFFQAGDADTFEVRWNGALLPLTTRDPEWKDPQIFSPKPQRTSGGKGDYPVVPTQRLLRLDYAVLRDAWRRGSNRVEIHYLNRGQAGPKGGVQLEKLEAHLRYA